MATYFTDFSEYSTGVAPSDWTARWATANTVWTVEAVAGTVGGQVLQCVKSDVNTRSALSWNDIDTDAARDDIEILAKMRISKQASGTIGGVQGRGSGTAGDETAYNGIFTGTPRTELTKYVNGTFTGFGSDSVGWLVDTWYWVRLRINGTSLKLRRWTNADSEPSTWNIEVTDSAITGAGWAAVFAFLGGAPATVYEWDVFSVGTGGDTAPMTVADVLSISVQPAKSRAGFAIAGPPTALVEDSDGTPISGRNVTVALQGGSFASGTTVVATDANGLAAFDDLVISAVGDYTLLFTATGVDDVVSNGFRVNPTVRSNTFNILESVAALPPPPAVHFPANSPTEVRWQIRNQARRIVVENVTSYVSGWYERDLWGENRFSLVIPGTVWSDDDAKFVEHPAIPHLLENNYVLAQVRERGESDWHDDFLGLIHYVHRSLENEENVEVRGDPILGMREILPPSDPQHRFSVDNPTQPHAAYDENTGNAESIMLGVVNAQFGTDAIPRRRLPNFFIGANQQRGGDISFRARYDNLLTKLQEMGRPVNLGFEPQPERFATGEVAHFFRIISGEDHSASSPSPVVFSPDNLNIKAQEYEVSILNRNTTAHVGGQGEGANRAIKVVHAPRATGDPEDRRALFLGGTDDRVDIPVSVARNRATLTIEGWSFLEEFKTPHMALFHESRNSDGVARLSLHVRDNAQLSLNIRPDDSTLAAFDLTTDNVPLDSWYWSAATIDLPNEAVVLYLWIPSTGVDVKQTFATGAISAAFVDAASNGVRFGHDPANDTYLHGRLSRWRVWHSVVPEATLKTVREMPTATSEFSNPHSRVHDWSFMDRVGQWVFDTHSILSRDHGEIKGTGHRWAQGPQGSPGLEAYSGADLKETFIDARDIANPDNLITRALAKFKEQGPKARFEASVLGTGPYRYRGRRTASRPVHWDLGDTISSRNLAWDVAADMRVERIRVAMDREAAPDIQVSFGAPFLTEKRRVNRALERPEPELHR